MRTGGMTMGKTNCDLCVYNVYDDDYECYCCEMNLEEDEMEKYIRSTFDNCPYFRFADEYRIVKKQM